MQEIAQGMYFCVHLASCRELFFGRRKAVGSCRTPGVNFRSQRWSTPMKTGGSLRLFSVLASIKHVFASVIVQKAYYSPKAAAPRKEDSTQNTATSLCLNRAERTTTTAHHPSSLASFTPRLNKLLLLRDQSIVHCYRRSILHKPNAPCQFFSHSQRSLT